MKGKKGVRALCKIVTGPGRLQTLFAKFNNYDSIVTVLYELLQQWLGLCTVYSARQVEVLSANKVSAGQPVQPVLRGFFKENPNCFHTWCCLSMGVILI